VKILCVGRKGRDILKRQFANLIVDTFEFTDVRRIGYAQAETVSKRVLDMFEAGEFDVATLFYSAFKNVVTQVPTGQQVIPASIPERADDAGEPTPYEYEPEETEIMNDLLPRNLTTQIFRALLENAASEQGARMSAMDNATRNAGDMIDKLTLTYNRSRQAQITKELIEIISGAEAL
jgi:F-type H+-transporting ATPase subunit gamma